MLAIRAWFLNRTLTSKLVMIFALPFLFLVVVTTYALLTFQEFERAGELANHSSQIKSQAIYYMDLLNAIQNGFRGYLLTGDRSFLTPYDASKGNIDVAGLELARLVADSPSQTQRDRVAKVQAITRRLIQEKEWILAHERSREEGVSYIRSGRGRELASAISSLLVEIEAEASQIYEARQAVAEGKRDLLLNVIVGGTALSLLLTGLGVSGEARQLVGDLHVGARLAVGIVQDILDLYRQAYGELPLSYTQFRLDQVVREVVDLLKPEIADRRLEITVSAPPSEITADQRRLYRVLVNLLDNAVKNSPSGGNVRILVSVRGEGSDRRAVVAVEDEGKGLDPAALDTLFEPNRPVTSPTRMGTGLGLYLCRIVIASHRGTIWAENRSEGGARFVFDIPAEVMHVDSTADRGRSTSVQAESAHRP